MLNYDLFVSTQPKNDIKIHPAKNNIKSNISVDVRWSLVYSPRECAKSAWVFKPLLIKFIVTILQI